MKLKGLIPFGLHHLFGGARRGRSLWAAFGAMALVAGLAAKYRPPKRELLMSKRIPEGMSIRVRFVGEDRG